jgi:hypothetical protein
MSRKKAQELEEREGDAAAAPDPRAFIKRLIEDAELRDAVGNAIESSRTAYERLTKSRKPHKLVDDEKMHADVQAAIDALREAAANLGEAQRERTRKPRRVGRKIVILGLGAGLALAGSEDLRSKVLDKLFGAEEEFEYTPPAGNGAPPPTATAAPPAAAAAPDDSPAPAAEEAAPAAAADESASDGASAGDE